MHETLDLAAIMAAADAPPSRPDRPVVRSGELAAILTGAPRPGQRLWSLLRPSRRARKAQGTYLVARQKLIEELHALGPVIAAAPGQPLTPGGAQHLLAANEDLLTGRLRSRADLDQYTIQIAWDARAVLTRFRDSAELQPLFSTQEALGGARIAQAVTRLQNRLVSGFADALEAACTDIIELPLEGTGEMILNHVCLVQRARRHGLDACLEDIDALWPEGLRIRQIGPGPAVSFDGLFFDQIPQSRIDVATALLGLFPQADPDEIRRARHLTLSRLGAPQDGRGPLPEEVSRAAEDLLRVHAARKALAAAGLDAATPVLLARFHRDGRAAQPGSARMCAA